MYRSIVGSLIGLILSSTAYAQSLGPYYLSSVGFCNIREMYIDVSTLVGYGREMGCASTAGYTFIGYYDTTAAKISVSRISPGATAGVNSELTVSVYDAFTNALNVFSATSQGITSTNRGLTYTMATVKPTAAILAAGKDLPNHDLIEQGDRSSATQ